jgi:hypothetical protein
MNFSDLPAHFFTFFLLVWEFECALLESWARVQKLNCTQKMAGAGFTEIRKKRMVFYMNFDFLDLVEKETAPHS